jgi:hypothetical protein
MEARTLSWLRLCVGLVSALCCNRITPFGRCLYACKPGGGGFSRFAICCIKFMAA